MAKHPMSRQPIVIQNVRRLGRSNRDTRLLSPAQACADCALRDGPKCTDCIDHALSGYGLIYRTPIVRH
ncbi:MAG TPA: hypothetical protein VFE10_01050 [Phenylobacterium sp.]|jgi:hypothetical protein|nr:hypothetical protein [Phenylobacterium sp.]